MKIRIVLLLTAVVLVHCNYKRETLDRKTSLNVVHADPEQASEVNLSEFIESVEYIKLQSDSNCILGRLREIIIKEKFIYAIDGAQEEIFIFDKKGNYVTRSRKRGQGQGEYNYIGPVFIDEDEKYIEIVDSRGGDSKLLKYENISFNFLDEKDILKVKANSCKRINDFYYYSAQQIDNIIDGKETNADVIVVNDDKTRILFDKKIVTNNNYYAFFSEGFTINDDNELFASLMFNDTFYKLEDFNALPYLSVDFGKFAIDNSIGFKSTTEQIKYLQNVSGAYFPVLNINNKNLLSFSYYYKDKLGNAGNHYYIKLKKTGDIFHANQIKNDLTFFPKDIHLSINHSVSHEIWHKDYLIDIVMPSEYFLSAGTAIEKEINGLGKVSVYDNPIIVLMKLKNL